jgi:hypothetical protein
LSTKRKIRMDKGRVAITDRVKKGMKFTIEQDVVSVPQLQELFARLSDEPTSTPLSVVRVLNIIRKWVDAGWVIYENPYRDRNKPGYIYATRKGIREFGTEHGYESIPFRVRDYSVLEHSFAVNNARLWCEKWAMERGYLFTWDAERILRAKEDKENPEKKFPDGVFRYSIWKVAVEVETSRKSKVNYVGIKDFYKQAGYNDVWYFHEPQLLGVLKEIFGDAVKYKSLDTLYSEDEAR